MVSKKSERAYIVKWIKKMAEVERLLGKEYEKYTDEVRRLITDFIQQHGVDVSEGKSDWRKKINQRELRELQNAISDLKEEELTEQGHEEAEHMSIPNRPNYVDYLVILSGTKTIRLMSDTEKMIAGVLEETIREEFEKQANNINLSRQYIENHIDDAVFNGVYQGEWSHNIWGMYQKDLHDDVSKLIRESVVRGQNPRKIAEKLRERVKASEYNAERLMRTEQASVQAESQLEVYEAQGVMMYELIVEPDGCEQCKEVEAQNPHLVRGAERSFNIQPLHPNCRCSTVAVVD